MFTQRFISAEPAGTSKWVKLKLKTDGLVTWGQRERTAGLRTVWETTVQCNVDSILTAERVEY
jgi:hypothetical protein